MGHVGGGRVYRGEGKGRTEEGLSLSLRGLFEKGPWGSAMQEKDQLWQEESQYEDVFSRSLLWAAWPPSETT